MNPSLHEHAVDFRHILRNEMKNWRLISFHPGAYRVDDYPRFSNNAVPLDPGQPIPEEVVTYYEFSDKIDAENFLFDISASHALREVARLEMKKLRAKNRRKTQRRVAKINKGNPHTL